MFAVGLILPHTITSFIAPERCHKKQSQCSTSSLHLWNKVDEVMEAIVLNNLFQVSTDDDKVAGAFDPKEVLAKFDLATLYNDDDVITSQESLVNYLKSGLMA